MEAIIRLSRGTAFLVIDCISQGKQRAWTSYEAVDVDSTQIVVFHSVTHYIGRNMAQRSL